MAEMPAGNERLVEGLQDRAQKTECRPGTIQTTEPSAQSGGIGHALRVLNRGSRGFPGITFHEVALQRLTAGNQAVVAVGRRERRQESERLPAPIAETSTDRNPIVLLVVRLFTAPSVTDDGIAQTHRTLAQDRTSISGDPIGFEVALGRRK
jgi:hypothetical protein